MELVVDANVWLSAAGAHEPMHRESARFVEGAIERRAQFLLPALVLPEVAGAASRRTRRQESGAALAEHLRLLPRARFFELDEERSKAAAQLAGRLLVRGADAQYAALALERRATLVTLDGELLDRTASIVPCLTPTQWLDQMRFQR